MLRPKLLDSVLLAALCFQGNYCASAYAQPVEQTAKQEKGRVISGLEQMLDFYRENESPKITAKVSRAIRLSECKSGFCALSDSDSELVREVQASLVFHNYLRHEADGVLDGATADAIRSYKRENALRDSDVIDSQLVSHLSTPSAERVRLLEEVVSLLEKDNVLGAEDGIYVNMPEFKMRYYHHGSLEFEMDVIIGNTHKDGRWKTMVQRGTLTAATINPWWYAPAGDVTADTRDLLRKSASLRKHTEQLVNGKWGIFENGVYGTSFRQRPGPNTFTGRIAFDFNGPYGEKLHGHPDKFLFNRNVRAFSHGCIRLRDEVGLFKALQGTGIVDPAIKIEDLVGQTRDGEYVTQEVKFNVPVDVRVFYLLAWAEESSSGMRMIMPVDVYDYRISRVK